jgi:hypothetical protein
MSKWSKRKVGRKSLAPRHSRAKETVKRIERREEKRVRRAAKQAIRRKELRDNRAARAPRRHRSIRDLVLALRRNPLTSAKLQRRIMQLVQQLQAAEYDAKRGSKEAAFEALRLREELESLGRQQAQRLARVRRNPLRRNHHLRAGQWVTVKGVAAVGQIMASLARDVYRVHWAKSGKVGRIDGSKLDAVSPAEAARLLGWSMDYFRQRIRSAG